MSTEIDVQSLEVLRSVRGTTLDWVAGVRYPGVAGYSEIRLGGAAGWAISVTSRIVDVDAELEVCVPVVQHAPAFDLGTQVDVFKVSAFQLNSIYRLQRREFVDSAREVQGAYQGTNPREHVLAEIDHDRSPGGPLVDAGVAFASGNGLQVELHADSFPLVFQLRLSVASSPVPLPRRVEVL